MGTLEDWTPYGAGEKTVPWNGRDPQNFFDLSNHPEAQINISAFALPDNAIIVKSDAHPMRHPEERSDEGSRVRDSSASPQNDKAIYIHAHHPREMCHEPKFQVEFPNTKEGTGINNKIMPVPSFGIDKIPVRVTLDPKDKDYLTANRFEVMFFVDSVFLFEQEEGTSPFTIELDSKRLGPGEHLLTINVMDYEDHIGVKTVKLNIPPVILSEAKNLREASHV